MCDCALLSACAGVDHSVLWSIEAGDGRRTGRFPTADFMGAGFNDARGDWLSQPQAVRPGCLCRPGVWTCVLIP